MLASDRRMYLGLPTSRPMSGTPVSPQSHVPPEVPTALAPGSGGHDPGSCVPSGSRPGRHRPSCLLWRETGGARPAGSDCGDLVTEGAPIDTSGVDR